MAKVLFQTQAYKPLRPDSLIPVIKSITEKLNGRVLEAYLFGSVARGDYRSGSDIDLVLIKETPTPFVRRAFEFEDLFDVFPRLDILVYTPAEFQKMRNQKGGFFKDREINRIV